MPNRSAGLLMHRYIGEQLQVLLVHPGGPYWATKDEGAWSIPKGEYPDHEDPLTAACREFREETGAEAHGPFVALTPIKQRSGKLVSVWAFEGEFNPESLRSNTFLLEWPPRSGTMQAFPEVDRGEWFSLEAAGKKILKSQRTILEELAVKLC